MNKEKDELCYPVKKVQFRTCVELYQKWRITKLRYKNAPSNGIEVEVEYADTFELINPEQESNFDSDIKISEYDIDSIKCFPLIDVGRNQNYKPLTALCLHGAPGCHRDYQYLIKYFIERNVRVIAPKFPNYDLTKKNSFQHSPAEKAEYIKDFLTTIKVDRIDLLLAHSSDLFVAARLINDSLNSFGLHMEDDEKIKKKCKKCKKDKTCSKCSQVEKSIAKDSELSDSTTEDEEDEELFRRFSLNFENFEKIYEEKRRLDKEGKVQEYKENSDLNDRKSNQEEQIKKKTDSEKKPIENDDKTIEKSKEKQINTPNEDEGYQGSSVDELVDGREARKRFSVFTIQKSKIYFGSLVLINVVSHRRSKIMNPVLRKSLYEPSSFFYQLKISRSVVRFCGKIYLGIFGSPIDYNNFDNLVLTLTTVLRSSSKSLRQQLERITASNLPIIFFFSENDRLITKGQSYELANFLNVNSITRDFSEPSHHNYDVFNYNSKKPKVEINNNNLNELNHETQIESQSFTSSDEYDSLKHNETEIESDTTSSTGRSSSSNDESSIKSKCDSELKSKQLNRTSTIASLSNQLILNHIKFPYAVSIKKGRHYSHITHSHVMDSHIGKLISILNLRN